jgi:hypothetical protein
MESIPKNKRYTIRRLLEIDPSLSLEVLKGKTILELSKMIDEQKVRAIEVIEHDEPQRSLLSYCGCEDY